VTIAKKLKIRHLENQARPKYEELGVTEEAQGKERQAPTPAGKEAKTE